MKPTGFEPDISKQELIDADEAERCNRWDVLFEDDAVDWLDYAQEDMSTQGAIAIGYRIATSRLEAKIEQACNQYPDLRKLFEE